MTNTDAPVPAYWPLIEALSACLCDALPDTIGGEVGRCCPMPGNALVLDDCCKGTAWVRLVRIDAVIAGGTAAVAGVPTVPVTWEGKTCGPNLAQIVIGMGVMRCAFSMDEHAVPPSCDELTYETLRTMSDIDAIYKAALCCQADIEVIDAQPLSMSPQGPEGGCVGAELQVAYTMDLCPCGEVDDGEGNTISP